MKYRMLALLLALVLVFALGGCQTEPEQTQPPTQAPTEPPETTIPEPTAPDALDAYSEAVAALEAAGTVTLDVVYTETTTAGTQSLTYGSEQVLTYNGLGTQAPVISLEEDLYTPDRKEDEEEEEEEKEPDFSEIYADGMIYQDNYMLGKFSVELSADEAARRYVPAALLDAALYEDMTAELDGDAVVVTFGAPTAPEIWAAPEDAQLVEATGSAVILDGQLQQMNYALTYTYGPAQITVEAESKPRQEAETVTAPEDTQEYLQIHYADALKSIVHVARILSDCDSVSSSSIESAMSQAGGVVRNQSWNLDVFGGNEDIKAKIKTEIYLMDYSTEESQTYSQEELYNNGKYTLTVDEGLPTSQSGISADVIEEYCRPILCVALNSLQPVNWEDVTVEEIGGTRYIAFQLNENFGNAMQNSACTMFWDDPSFLMNYASDYALKEATGYLALDQYTGAPTAAGIYYEGVHTIEDTEYLLSMQYDQAITCPSFGAYEEITEQLLPEEAPENPATPLFYHVTGDDGQEMWLLGTIHVGDERTGFLPQEIYDALAASDALALEIDADALEEKMEEDEELQSKLSDLYFYSDGTAAADHIDEETYALALKYLKASGNHSMNAPYMKLSEWSNSIENFYLRLGHHLHNEQGVEERLTKLAHDQEKEILEVEDVEAHIRTTTDWSDALQALLLEETLAYTAEEYWTEVDELYELWCAGDEAELIAYMQEEDDTSEMTPEELQEYNDNLPLYDEYDKTMSHDRNGIMLDVAIDYLEGDKVVFYAVGLAHLLEKDTGLVEALRNAGYTVELVVYQ